MIEEHPIALQLRYLQTLLELGSSQSTTIVFPAPIDIICAVHAAAATTVETVADVLRRDPVDRPLGGDRAGARRRDRAAPRRPCEDELESCPF